MENGKWKTRNIITCTVCVLLLFLAGCGFQPMYGERDSQQNVVQDLNAISIGNIPDRPGQIMRNYLIDSLYAKGRPSKPLYHLSVTVRSTEEDLGILRDTTATRVLMTTTGNFELTDIASKQVLLKGTVQSVASFNKNSQLYGELAAQEAAQRRTIKQVSDQIVLRLGLFFSERD
ncbi:MAG: LPS assembly lipoprotein LptE [Alphaproteobacteria bacterium]|nr:LPS assembly lipoprotein LptE [Alphaproteobacteria bacterium]MCL2506005.1 LPS assembly lipoprotein LptE [Alphaproteobacteria bacterium]